MPRVNIYIRNEDYAAWESIEAKPEFIHMSIVNYGLMGETASDAVRDLANKDFAKHVKEDDPPSQTVLDGRARYAELKKQSSVE